MFKKKERALMLFFHIPSSRKAIERKHAVLCDKVRRHFAPVLNTTLGGEPAFDLTGKVEAGGDGERLLTVGSFVSLFGKLVERGDYHKSSYLAENSKMDLCFKGSLFDEWQAAGCLLWD